MFYLLLCLGETKNTKGYWLRFVFVLSGFVNSKRCQSIILFVYSQEKSRCCNLEVDSKIESSKDIIKRRKKITEFILDENQIKVGSGYNWIWVAIVHKNFQILALSISKERNMLISERFLSSIMKDYGKNIVSTDRVIWYPRLADS